LFYYKQLHKSASPEIAVFPPSRQLLCLLTCAMPNTNTQKGLAVFYNNPGYDTTLEEIFFTAVYQNTDYSQTGV
jgi:hypothetical protein